MNRLGLEKLAHTYRTMAQVHRAEATEGWHIGIHLEQAEMLDYRAFRIDHAIAAFDLWRSGALA